jgi:signal transduction histidine kinase
MRTITISSAVFTLAFVINVIKAQIPTISPSVTPIAQAGAAVSAILFYIAFIPPHWLRRAWQMEEVYGYLLQSRISSASDPLVTQSLEELSRGVQQATNGIASGIVKLDGTKWSVRTATNTDLFANLLQKGEPLIKRAWEYGKAMSVYVPDIPDPAERAQLKTIGAQTWLFMPVQSQKHYWGLLVVALKERALFVDDDLSLLKLLVRECALILDNRSLIDELQDYSEQLEAKIEERTAALQQSNEELRNYAYVASHDLQEPLRTVTSYLQLIEMRYPDKLDNEGREFIAFAVDGAMRMKALIDDLLTYSRVERREAKFIVLDMQQVLERTQKSLEAAITETNARITYDELPKLVADEELMLQVFENLISNALKYRSERTPEIHISVICQDDEWRCSVRDNGIGIEEEFLERIFIMFQRLHTREKYPGTGIGLAVCKRAVEQQDGRIWAESVLGQGSTFHFTIPVRLETEIASVA